MEAVLEHGPEETATYTPRALATGELIGRESLLRAPLKSMPRPSILDAPITELRGAGRKLAAAAAEIGISSLGDLLGHVPHGYRNRAQPVGLANLKLGEEATVEVEVSGSKLRPTRRRRLTILEADVADSTGRARAVWFNRAWLADRLQPGARLLLRGKLEKRSFNVSEHEFLDSESSGAPAGLHTTGMVPVHPASERLRPQRIREWVWQAVPMAQHAVEPIPGRLRRELRMAGAADSLVASHFPADGHAAEAARERLAFEELFLYQAALVSRRGRRVSGSRGVALPPAGARVAAWLESLPFSLTGDQRRAVEEVNDDVLGESPMQRLLMGEVGSGKAQPLDSLVLTPSGFRPMGEIQVGEEVINPTGERTPVTGVFPQGSRDVYRVWFSDGTHVECDLEHLWQVQTSTARCRRDKPKVMTLKEIAVDLRRPSGAAKWHVELPEPVDLECGLTRPLDPYALGLLLGDGGLSIHGRVRLTSSDQELVDALRTALLPECELRQETHRPYDWKITRANVAPREEPPHGVTLDDLATLVRAYESGASHETIAAGLPVSAATVRLRLRDSGVVARPPFRRNPIIGHLKSLDLMGKESRGKFVPTAYLAAPIDSRHALLQGLMDTDGTVSRAGQNVSFTSVSERLAQDVAWLVRSLGGRARCRRVVRKSGSSWRTSVILPARFPPFRLTRKRERLRPRTKYANPAKAIMRIEPRGKRVVQCISVAHPNQLYITDGFTVTHNTVIALYTMLRAIEAGHQAALMAPTETLAEQHFRTLESLLSADPAPATLLTSATPPARRRELLDSLAAGEPQLVVGTHALIEGAVEFSSLAVAVVDEQH
ncbi:MAG: LAGLIDADG family homing endonuclease, partial [Solirubrobacterales bacterium]